MTWRLQFLLHFHDSKKVQRYAWKRTKNLLKNTLILFLYQYWYEMFGDNCRVRRFLFWKKLWHMKAEKPQAVVKRLLVISWRIFCSSFDGFVYFSTVWFTEKCKDWFVVKICDVLRDLVPFVPFKKREKLPWKSVTFTKSNIPLWVFFTVFKLYKWYQITQNVTSVDYCDDLLAGLPRASF